MSIADEYIIITDTREQKPLKFRKNQKTGTLKTGDYIAEYKGRPLNIIMERKSGNDFFGTITRGHERFKREINRAKKENKRFIILVECSYFDFINKKFEKGYLSKLDSMTIQKILHKMLVRHHLEIYFFNNRSEMTRFIRNTFNALVEEEKERIKKREKLKKKFLKFLNQQES